MTRRSDLSPKGRVFEAVLVVMIVVLCVVNFVRIDSVSNSASDTLINWVPQTAILTIVALLDRPGIVVRLAGAHHATSSVVAG
ncbi:MAG: hypothetical protein ACXWH0_15785 [Acidimicrobiia bacterium]